ncbi:DivIVA domain-containing protein [Kroppenstedtia pulmonis]|uniref:DivIVA domain-containing protein n=1 Tax=Kroppenstedtia pulmonis TaxID=1380685 RepID=A0A7D3XJ45_9BACL|nr:DivIVA domain-containing protein [Kroppenstedtia pulmonis]QKG84904.1 DivIVA domain-containing protein [Kroppenstedtia pulmonis]
MERITPSDIFNKDFKTSLRGYDVDEVNEFLDIVIKNFEDLIEENRQLKEDLKASKSQRGSNSGNQDAVIQNIIRRLEHLEQIIQHR